MTIKTQPAAPCVATTHARSRRSTRGLVGASALLGLLAACALPALAQSAETPQQYCERQVGFVRDVCLRELKSAPPPAAPAASAATSPRSGASAPPSGAAPAKAAAATPAAAAGGAEPYVVSDGHKVDAFTFKGFQAWRAAACDRCHGANQEGLVGPSLIEGLKKLSKDEFRTTVLEGRLERGMPSFGSSEQVKSSIDNLYAYLKGRSDGAITQSRVELAK